MTVKELFESLIVPGEPLNTDQVIKTFEANQDFILNTNIYSSDENYFFVALLIHHYGRGLRIKERYSKALLFLNRAMPLLENDAVFEQEDLRNRLRTDNHLDRGVAYYRKSNYKKAKEDFIWLTNQDPENENYRNWLISTKTRHLDIISWWVLSITVTTIAIEHYIPKEYKIIRLGFFTIPSIGIIIYWVLIVIVMIRKRKMKANSQ